MPVKDFIPTRDGDLDSWEDNFSTKLTTHGTTIGFTAPEVTAIQTTITTHRTAYTDMIDKKAVSKSAVETNGIQKGTSVDEIRRVAKRAKSATAYTQAIGEDLGIIGPEFVPPDPNTVKPVLRGQVSGQVSIIDFEKLSADGVKIYSKRGNEGTFTFLAVDTSAPYTDNRAKLFTGAPEERNYYAYFFTDDTEIGVQSDTIKVIVP